MFTQLVIGSAIFSGGLAAGLAPTPSTSDATITPGPQLELLRKQDDARYMGWWYWNGEWTTRECDLGGTYYQSSDFWRCCATTADGCAATDIPVGCISGSLIYSVTGSSLSSSLETWACTSIYTELEDRSFTVCNTGFMFENDRDSDPLTNVNCGVSSLRWSYYRVAPAEATAITSIDISSSPASTPAVSTPTSTSDFPTLISTPEGEEKKESKAWIAGAVVGPIVGLALIGLGVFFFLRRKKNKQAQPAAGAGAPPAAPNAAYPQQTYPPGPNSPPQYYPPPMQQNAGAPGMVPFGVTKHDSWAGQQSPVTQGSMSPNAQSPYGGPPQQGWQGQNNLQINQAPSPSMSPQQGYAQPTQYGGDNGMYKHTSETVRPFSSELEGSSAGQGQPDQINMQPKTN
ncbi:Nn.00g021920.m01.CDS01 [Neocucurbitaria sp. VM-36]